MEQEQSRHVASAVAPGLSRHLAERALALRARGVPPEILAATKRAVMNALGAAALGSHRSALIAAIGYASDQSAGISGGALIPWHSDRLSVADAAFITGAMIHLEDFDDSYFACRIHPTAAVCGALLPFAYDAKCTGQQFLEALSIGTEAEIAVGLGLVPTAYDRGFHLTSVAGGVGAAVGCGLIQGLGVDELEAAIGIALGSSIGYTVMFGSDMKAFGVGHAARAGVVAVGLAARGFTSAPDAIEGLGGVVSAICDDAKDAVARMAAAIGELGTTWRIPGIVLKRWPTGHGMHAPLDATERMIRRRPELLTARLTNVVISVPGWFAGMKWAQDKVDAPASYLEAKFDIPYCVAIMLAYGEFRASYLDEQFRSDPRVDEIRKLIHIVFDPEIALGQALLKIEADGLDSESEFVERCVGSPPDVPLTDEYLEAKLRSSVLESVPATSGQADTVDRIIEAIDGLDSASQTTELSELLAMAGGQ